MELLELIKKSECINWIVTVLRPQKKYITRSLFSIQTVSCRIWQLMIMVLQVYHTLKPILNQLQFFCASQDRKDLRPIQQQITEIIHIINTILTHDTPLYHIILQNNPILFNDRIGIVSIHSIEELDCIPHTLYPMCIYANTEKENSILHYFTIVLNGSSYVILSSYGSDYVDVPQYSTSLDPQLFNDFCNMITIPLEERERHERYTTIVTEFVTLYFLSGGIRKRYDEDTIDVHPSLHSKWLEPELGITKEVDVFMKNKYTFSVGWIKGYDTEIQHIMKTLKYTGKSRRKPFRRKHSIKKKPSRKKYM
jgi:hypothetical protein